MKIKIKKSRLMLLIIVIFAILYPITLLSDGLWIYFLFILALLILATIITYIIKKFYPQSKILKFLESIKEMLQEAFP